jgi:glycosyltransferase involved in cell wall biosynthesis
VHVHAQPAGLRATLAALRGLDVLLLPDDPDAETEAALETIALPQSRGVTVGPPACFNRLAIASDARVIVLLESGCVPAPGWLEALLDPLDQGAGLAGPSTNLAWNEQASKPIPGEVRTLAPLHGLADFCLAVRRGVLDAVGAADEGFGLGPCWEMEYTARALCAGFPAVWACGAYVHRAPFTPRRAREERARMGIAKRRYQDAVCALRLTGARDDYEDHCRGEACEHFAPAHLMTIHRPLGRPAATPKPPLVSCIMPTGDRPEFAAAAIDLLRRQDYTAWELVIVDDGSLPLELPDDPRLRHLRAPAGETVGAKRNRAIEAARGAFIVHWDDDDYYAPQRLRHQLEPLLRGEADITALRAGLILELDPWACWEITPELHRRLFVEDVHGGTLAYRRDVWERSRFPPVSLAEDASFLRGAIRRGARLKRLDNDGLFVYVRHPRCAWRFECGRYLDPSGWRRVAPPSLPPHLAPRPLITAIMPTADRRAHVARALAYFARQDHLARELIVVDDGTDRVGDLIGPGVRYIECDPMPLGAKRNLACEHARGELIVHWDDDDWSAPHRLRYQLSQLETAEVGGADRLLYLDASNRVSWLYAYGGRRRWVAGNTLCYTAATWRRRPFPAVPVGEDARFLAGRRIRVAADHRFLVGMVHDANASRKRTEGAWWSRVPLADVSSVLGADAEAYLGQRRAP